MGLLFVIVTGSHKSKVYERMKKAGYHYYPHILASDLGTEITYFHQGGIEKDQEWEEYLLKGHNFNIDLIEEMVDILKKQGIDLIKEKSHTSLKSHYYYYSNLKNDSLNLEKIKDEVSKRKISVSINKCNPLAGDPENAYDICFLPLKAGKHEVVKYLLGKYKIDYEKSIAFGDSGNDLQMLAQVKHGYLVKNATEEAKLYHKSIVEAPYAEGILRVINKLVK